MKRLILLTAAVGLLTAGPVSALTMTPTADNRIIGAGANAEFDSDFNSDTPGPGFPNFSSNVSANASSIPVLVGDTENGFYGSFANANAGQNSSLGALTISGSGHANASGSHGGFPDLRTANLGGGGGGGGEIGDFQAHGRSFLSILFSIDEAAAFDISGFLSGGIQLAGDSDAVDDNINRASIILVNSDTNESAFKTEVSNGSENVNESGVIGPGNYEFSVEAYAEVFGQQIFTHLPITSIPQDGYSTGASFEAVTLELSAIDQPIPEPVTTTLAAMGLGALVLRTSRRRHA